MGEESIAPKPHARRRGTKEDKGGEGERTVGEKESLVRTQKSRQSSWKKEEKSQIEVTSDPKGDERETAKTVFLPTGESKIQRRSTKEQLFCL